MYFEKLIEDVKRLEERTEGIYVYGAGFYGKDVCKILQRNNIKVNGFIVTEVQDSAKVLGLPVLDAKEIIHGNYGIVLGLNDTYLQEVNQYLQESNINMENVVDGGTYLFGVNGRGMIRKRPIVEVTTIMGCEIDCKFCPQKLLLQKYYERDKKRKSIMTTDDFQVYLKHVPSDCDFIFAGMSEPFRNKDCIKLLKMACDAGHKVSIYTTLVGASRSDVDEMLKLPLHFVVLHVADKYEYAHIPLSEQYFELVEMVLSAKKGNGEPFVNTINAQAEPNERIAELCKGKYEVLTSLHDRAGNLEGENLSKREKKLTNEKIYCCSCGTELNNQVLLPDGTLVLCNMDFGLQHQLGNLLIDDYETIRSGEEIMRIRKGMDGDGSIDILCRNCCLSRLVKEE